MFITYNIIKAESLSEGIMKLDDINSAASIKAMKAGCEYCSAWEFEWYDEDKGEMLIATRSI